MNPVSITHTCGHTVTHHAWGKRIDWLATKPCPACAGVKHKAPAEGKVVPLPRPSVVKAPEALPDLPPGYVQEYRFAPPRKWRFDYAWPGAKVALELEGGSWTGGRHVSGKGFENDCAKYNQAAFEGWRVFRATPRAVAAVVTFYVFPLVTGSHNT